ncbi:SRPBCC domain-containing protein [Reichenbachiella versicolor]|uniref:SRPBCC domain-containing protein n=1 Tax=Reichenbachiella versicolor TaxID=1821036 RepID=UPI000D6E0B24|nr:SRPBCC domain-containing protein [Reichenbachiella versicolor]
MSNLKNRTLSLEKIFDAPIELVWEAWTSSEHIIKWWAPPGMDLKVIEHNFKVGGKWKYTMPMPDGTEFISEGTYKEIVEMEKIVTSADFRPMTENVELHASFEKLDNQTKFTFSVIHETEDYCKQQEKMGFYNGWGSAFDRLESLVINLK